MREISCWWAILCLYGFFEGPRGDDGEDVLSCDLSKTVAMEMSSGLVSTQRLQSALCPVCNPDNRSSRFEARLRRRRRVITHTQDHKEICRQCSWVFVSRVQRRVVRRAVMEFVVSKDSFQKKIVGVISP